MLNLPFNKMKNKKSLSVPCCLLLLLLAILLAGQLLFSDRHAFNLYTAQLCRETLSQDTLSLHYALADPGKYGLACDTVTLGSFPDAVPDGAAAALENQSAVLKSFVPERLSAEQAFTLEILQKTNDLEQKLLEGYAFWDQPSSALGIQAQLPILFAEYAFRSREDIDVYFLLLQDTERYFTEYLQYLQQKCEMGCPPAAETLQAMTAQCREFLGNRDPQHFLQTVFVSRCQDCSFLTDAEAADLADTHFQLLETYVFRAYDRLISGLEALYNRAGTAKGLTAFPGGREYYETYLQYICGTDLSLEDIRLRLYTQLLADIESAGKLDLTALEEKTPYDDMEAADMLTALEKQICACFPSGPDTLWTLKEVDPELAQYSSPAFYMVPPVDDLAENTIYINPQENLTGFSLYTTLAHEGFPGHLYQNTYYYSLKPPLIRRLLSFGGYSEGWATYTESLICEMAGKDWEGARVYWLDRSLNLCIASLLDIGIHGDGWDLENTQSFLADFGITDASAAKELYQYIIENPGNYLRYYLGCLSFLDLRSRCRRDLGDAFDLTAFHQAVLETGPCPFSLLETQVRRRLGLSAS